MKSIRVRQTVLTFAIGNDPLQDLRLPTRNKKSVSSSCDQPRTPRAQCESIITWQMIALLTQIAVYTKERLPTGFEPVG